MIVQYVNKQTKYPVRAWRELLSGVLPAALSATALGRRFSQIQVEAELAVTFAGPRVMKRINLETRETDQLTDVLSFPLLDMAEGRLLQPLGKQDYDPGHAGRPVVPLGDIIISLDKAHGQAADYGHSVEREVAFLAVHGLLHLLGYDHQTPAQEKKMLLKQRQILGQLGITRKQGVNTNE